jgi:hypothetical protein
MKKLKNGYLCLMALFTITAFANYNEYSGGGGGGGGGFGGYSTNSDAANGGFNSNYQNLYGSTGAYGSNNTGSGGYTGSGNTSGGGGATSPTTTTLTTYISYNYKFIWNYFAYPTTTVNPEYYAAQYYALALGQMNNNYSQNYSSSGGGGGNNSYKPPILTLPMTPWFYDGDGYHSKIVLAASAPYTLFKATTLGLDCDDNNGLINTDCTPAVKPPCELISILEKDDNFRGRMKGLISASLQFSFENAIVLYKNPTPTTANQFTYVNAPGSIAKPGLDYNATTAMQGLLHSHYKDLLSIFSATDLQDMYQKMKLPAITDDYFSGVVCPQGNAYIMQVEDRAAFIAFGDKYLSTVQQRDNFDVTILQNKYNIKMDNTATDNELGFLKMMKELNSGINIAKETFDPKSPTPTTNPDLFKKLQKLNYNTTTKTVETNNCN